MSALPSTYSSKADSINFASPKNYEVPDVQRQSSNGRTFKSAMHSVGSFCFQPIHVAQKILSAFGSVVADPNALASVLRRLNCQVLDALEQVRNIPCSIYKFRGASCSYIGLLDTLQVFGDMQYFSNKEYKNDHNLKVTARVAGAVANAGGALLWLEELNFLNLSNIAHKLGEVRVFSKLPAIVHSIPLVRDVPSLTNAAASLGKVHVFGGLKKLSMGLIAGRALVLYYLFSALDSLRKVAQSKESFERKQAGLDLSYYASELALNSLLIVGVASTAGLGVLGATCIATGLASFTYKNYK